MVGALLFFYSLVDLLEIIKTKENKKKKKMQKVILVTGGCGFIASNFLLQMVPRHPTDIFVNIDRMDVCASFENVKALNDMPNYHFRPADIGDREVLNILVREFAFTHVLHFAAQTHVDNSFEAVEAFVRDNILATTVLLDSFRHYPSLQKFIFVSTDEVLGDQHTEAADEQAPLHPTNPYAASKAAAELLCLAYHRSFKIPVIITRGNNVYGPRQYPEKVVPRFLLQAFRHQPLTIHGTGEQRRSFLYVDDAVAAFATVLERGVVGEIYNIGVPPTFEFSIKDLAHHILTATENSGVANTQKEMVHVTDRAYNDQHYRVQSAKLAQLGWCAHIALTEGLKRTLEWYAQNDMAHYWTVLPSLT